MNNAAQFGPPDILINNTGILRECPLAETRAEDFDRVIAVILRGAFLTSREFMRRSASCRIINIASNLGHLWREDRVAYTASRAGSSR